MSQDNGMSSKRIVFVEMMGVPGSYDASVYDHFADRDQEGIWFTKRFGHLAGITISTCNVCTGEALPEAIEADGLVLAGSYNSVHDDTDWQRRVLAWLPVMRARKVPILAICGSHQLMAHGLGVHVERLVPGPYAGTFPVQLTDAGRTCPIMASISPTAGYHYANSEHVVSVPAGSTLLASSDTVPVAALDYGDHCYSTQFHPEGTHETLGTVWRFTAPERMENYIEDDAGKRLVENFLRLVVNL